MFKIICAAASVVAAISIASAARAVEVADSGFQVEVNYSDLDVTHTQGASILLARIKQAAHRVCGPEPASGDLDHVMDFRRCVRDSMGRAVAELNNPLVSDLYDGRESNRVAAAR